MFTILDPYITKKNGTVILEAIWLVGHLLGNTPYYVVFMSQKS